MVKNIFFVKNINIGIKVEDYMIRDMIILEWFENNYVCFIIFFLK